MALPVIDNPWSSRLHAIIAYLQHQNNKTALANGIDGADNSSLSLFPKPAPLASYTYVLREDCQDSTVKGLFFSHFICDRGVDGQPTYAAWLTFLQGKVASGSF